MSRTIAAERRRVAVSLLLLVVLLAPPAGAGPTAAEKAEAEALFQEGKKLMLSKRWGEACKKLEASQRLDPGGGTLLNLALCHEEEGRLSTAWVEFGDALAQAKVDKKNDRIKIAREHLDRIEPKLPRLTIEMGPGGYVSGLKVTRDDSPLSEAGLGTAIPVDPGDHVVRATAPHYKPYEGTITVGIGETKTLTIPPLDIEPDALATASASAPPSAPPPVDAGSRRLIGYVAGGVGLASLAVGAFFGVRTFSKKGESDKECPTATTCSRQGADLNNQAYTSATIANIGVGVGLVGLGVGTFLILTSKPAAPASARGASPRFTLTPAFGAGLTGLQAQGHF